MEIKIGFRSPSEISNMVQYPDKLSMRFRSGDWLYSKKTFQPVD